MKNISFELDIVKAQKTIKKNDRVVFGYASTYDVDSDDTQITRKALENAKKDLLQYSTVLFNHNPDRPIGKVIETEIDDIGLLVKVVLSKEESEIWKKVQEGVINKFSIKGRTSGLKPVEGAGQISQIEDIELFEVSLVSVPANATAETISHYIAKSLQNIETSNKSNMKELIKKLKTISGKKEIKEDLDKLVKDLEEKEDLLSDLQIIAGKLTEKDQKVISDAIEELKAEKQLDKTFDLEDETEKRPLFQLNSSGKFEFDEKANKFRKQILKLGKWYHWNAEGGVLKVTPEMIDNIVKNFKKKVVENVSIPLTHTSDPSKNTGEVVELIKTDKGLDGVCEIKDETISEKIKKGLIKHISASLDSNYRVKTSNKFVGPTLLHTALVAEGFVKGMSPFVALADDYKDRSLIQLEDEKPDLFKSISGIETRLEKVDEKLSEQDTMNETFATITKDEDSDDENKEEDEKKEKEETEKKSKYSDCMAKEMKAGKSMEEASKICKEKINKMIDENKEEVKEETSEESSDSKPEEKSEETTSPEVDLADVERVYEDYLKQGKIVPAQKKAFIKLLSSKGAIELGENNKVELSEDLKTFLGAQPKIVDFEENGTPESDKKDEDEEVPSEVKKLYTNMGLSDEDAEKSWKFAKELSNEEKDEKESTVF